MNVFDAAEGFLPQLELNGNVELLETSLEMTLKSIGVAQVDGVHLRGVLGSSLDMVSQKLAKTAELGLSGILEAEIESLHGSALVKNFETSIVAEDIENGSVCFPQEFEPRGDDGTVSAVAGLFSRDSSKEDGLRSLGGFQIVDIRSSSSIDARLNFVGLLLGSGDLFNGQLDEFLQDKLSRCY